MKLTQAKTIAAVFIALTLVHCAAHRPSLKLGPLASGASLEAAECAIQTLGFLPFREMRGSVQTAEAFPCPTCEDVDVQGGIDIGASQDLNTVTQEVLNQVRPAWLILTLAAPEEASSKTVAQIASQAGADAVLEGRIFRYEELAGNALAAQRPASVAFAVRLLDARTGALLCWGMWNETQQALSDSILDIGSWLERKGQWVKARDLAREGLLQILGRCPAGTAGSNGSDSLQKLDP